MKMPVELGMLNSKVNAWATQFNPYSKEEINKEITNAHYLNHVPHSWDEADCKCTVQLRMLWSPWYFLYSDSWD